MDRRLRAAVAVVVCALVRSAPARADEPDDARKAAAAHFAEGRRAFDAGDYLHAADEFDAANARAPHYDTLWNAAQAADRAGALARAANEYLQYLKLAPFGSPDRDRATQALRRLARRLSVMHVRHEGVTAVQLDATPLASDEVYAEPGIHVVTGRSGDAPVSERVATREGETVTVTLAAPAPTPTPTPTPASRRVEASAPPPAPTEGSHGLPGWVFFVGAGATVVAGAFAIGSGLDTVAAAHRFDAHPSADALDEGKGKQLRTNVLWAVTGALALATSVAGIWLVDWHPARERSLALELDLGLGVARVAGRF